jgi:hypothetical protein
MSGEGFCKGNRIYGTRTVNPHSATAARVMDSTPSLAVAARR